MTRYTKQQWIQYIQNELDSEQQAAMEQELMESDAAIHQYLEVFDELQMVLPALHTDSFVDSVMQAVTEPSALSADIELESSAKSSEDNQRNNKRHIWMQQPIFHYAIASTITLILFASGLFEHLLQAIPTTNEQTSSITEILMNHATSILDIFKS